MFSPVIELLIPLPERAFIFTLRPTRAELETPLVLWHCPAVERTPRLKRGAFPFSPAQGGADPAKLPLLPLKATALCAYRNYFGHTGLIAPG